MAQAFQDDDGKWGVRDDDGGLIYEADFPEAVAKRIAELESEDEPPEDWEATESILEREGYQTS